LDVLSILLEAKGIEGIGIVDDLDEGAGHICCYPQTCVVGDLQIVHLLGSRQRRFAVAVDCIWLNADDIDCKN